MIWRLVANPQTTFGKCKQCRCLLGSYKDAQELSRREETGQLQWILGEEAFFRTGRHVPEKAQTSRAF